MGSDLGDNKLEHSALIFSLIKNAKSFSFSQKSYKKINPFSSMSFKEKIPFNKEEAFLTNKEAFFIMLF